MKNTTPVLTIVTSRQSVKIDGKPYFLRSQQEIAFRPRGRRHAQALIDLGALLKKTRRTSSQESQLRRLLGEVTAAILDAPPAVLTALRDEHRLAILSSALDGVAR